MVTNGAMLHRYMYMLACTSRYGRMVYHIRDLDLALISVNQVGQVHSIPLTARPPQRDACYRSLLFAAGPNQAWNFLSLLPRGAHL